MKKQQKHKVKMTLSIQYVKGGRPSYAGFIIYPNKYTINPNFLSHHCMNFGIYKTFTFYVIMPKDPLSSPLLKIYFNFAFKSKGLKGDLFVIFTWCFKDSNVPLCGVFKVNLNMTFILCKSV